MVQRKQTKANLKETKGTAHGLDSFPLAVLENKHPTEMESHCHDFTELVYVKSGKGLHIHDKNRYPIHKGDCFVILPGMAHSYVDVDELKIFNVLFYQSTLDSDLEDITRTKGFQNFFSIEPIFRDETSFCYKLHLSPSIQQYIVDALEELKTELEEEKAGYQSMCMGLFRQVLVTLCRSSEHNAKGTKSRIDLNVKHEVVSQTIAFIEANSEEKISLTELARSVHVSESHLSHLFKDKVGISPFEYLTRVRIDRACEMLRETGENITDIAFSVGFHNSSYFSRTFKKITGCSPTRYRSATSCQRNAI